MTTINKYQIHQKEISYLEDILLSSDLSKNESINLSNYFYTKDNIYRMQGVNVQFSAERDLNQHDNLSVSFGHNYTSIKDRRIWFPFLLFKNPEEYIKKREYSPKERFCSFVVFNPRGEMRNRFFDFVNKYKKVDSLGQFRRNCNDLINDTGRDIFSESYLNVLSKYKFMICFENESTDYYLTEKLGNAYLSGCIPIYWGMKNVEHVINPKCFIHIRGEEDFEEALNKIKELDQDEEKYKEMFNEPLFRYNKVPYYFTKEWIVSQINKIITNLASDRNKDNDRIVEKTKVISYCLYGTGEKYILGSIRNAELAPLYYPTFECWFYTDISVDQNIIEQLKKYDFVKIIYIDIRQYPNTNFTKCVRFLPMSDDSVELMLSRDTDSRFSIREVNAVIEWMKSGKTFHIIRDHPYHGYKILGGAWASRKIPNFDFKEKMEIYKSVMGIWDVDQRFLIDKVYPIIREDSVIHDNYFKYESHAKDFPDDYIDYSFVGEYVNYVNIDGKLKEKRGDEWKFIKDHYLKK
jgi:hypothetical protein